MLYEYRVYEALPGRLPDLHRRFRDITLWFFQKHGIRVVAFFDVAVGASNELHYIVAFDSMAQRERAWTALQNDPDWQQAKARTEASGPLVARIKNQFWTPTEYSPKL